MLTRASLIENDDQEDRMEERANEIFCDERDQAIKLALHFVRGTISLSELGTALKMEMRKCESAAEEEWENRFADSYDGEEHA